jgi:hypothetical protein
VQFAVDIHLMLTSFNVDGQLDKRTEFRFEGPCLKLFYFNVLAVRSSRNFPVNNLISFTLNLISGLEDGEVLDFRNNSNTGCFNTMPSPINMLNNCIEIVGYTVDTQYQNVGLHDKTNNLTTNDYVKKIKNRYSEKYSLTKQHFTNFSS